MRTAKICSDEKLLTEAKCCATAWSQTLGLMFSRRKKALVFQLEREKRVSIHTFFMLFPVDLIFLNDSCLIVEIRKSLKPWRFYSPRNPARYVIEAPADFVEKNSLREGITLQLR